MKPKAVIAREQCLALFRTGVAAADPGAAVRRCLQIIDGRLRISPEPGGPAKTGYWRKIHIIAFGKAACAMAEAARLVLPLELLAEPGIVVTTYDNAIPLTGFEVLDAGHPLPDANGLEAALKVATKDRLAGQDELILVLISGGGSALLPYPVDGVSLDDKIATTELLLASGADINQINCVRKHLSRLKGGGLARMAQPADLHALILSDVLGDDLSSIASGPTVADATSFADAIAVLENKGIWDKAPPAVKEHLTQGVAGLRPETAKPSDSLFERVSHTLVGGNSMSIDAEINAAQAMGYQTRIFSRHLCGEARQAAERLAHYAKTLFDQGIADNTAVIAGGETTVTLTGKGFGGRNQELALAFALAAERQNLPGCWTFLSAGTDGRDGPTNAAGGLVDHRTLTKIREAGFDPQAALIDNDSYNALKAGDALVITGATGTNVADLQILLLHPFTE